MNEININGVLVDAGTIGIYLNYMTRPDPNRWIRFRRDDSNPEIIIVDVRVLETDPA